MQPFKTLVGLAAPLPRANLDTDVIIRLLTGDDPVKQADNDAAAADIESELRNIATQCPQGEELRNGIQYRKSYNMFLF